MDNRVAVVILNYNGKVYLKKFLPSVINFSKDCHIVVADNNSTDDSLEFLKDTYPNVQIIEFRDNLGYSGGYKKALESIHAHYYILLNSDIEVTENWITPIITLMEDDHTIAACQPKILDYKEKNKFEYAGAAGGYIDLLGYPFCRGRIFNHIEHDHYQYEGKKEIFWATGACLFLRASAYHEIGGLDESYFAHMEEIDLCWRLKNQGYGIYYCSESKVYHIGGGTLSKSNPFKTYLNFRNSLITLLKNSLFWELMWKLPLRLALDLIAAIKFLATGYRKDAFAILKAHISFLQRLKENLNKRRLVLNSGKEFRHKEMYNGLIIYDYFIKKKKTII